MLNKPLKEALILLMVLIMDLSTLIIVFASQPEYEKTIENIEDEQIITTQENAIQIESEPPIIKIWNVTNSLVAKEDCRVRLTPTTKLDNTYDIISKGTLVDIVEELGDWSRVLIGNDTYFICSRCLVSQEEYDKLNTIPISDKIPLEENVQKHLYTKCQEYGIDFEFALAVIDLETGGTFNPNAYHKNTNGSTDRGLCQVNSCWTKTFKNMGFISSVDDLFDPMKSIDCGMYILGQYVAQYGNVERSYASYNTGKAIKSNKNSREVMRRWEKWESTLAEA